MSAKDVILSLLWTIGGCFIVLVGATLVRARRAAGAGPGNEPESAPEAGGVRFPRFAYLATGFVTNFFDALGIGSYATTTTIYRFKRLVPDRVIPGTLNVGHTLASITEAIIFIKIVEVEATTLAFMIAGAVAGALLSASLVARLPKRQVQLGMGLALGGAALLMLSGLVGAGPRGGDALGLSGATLFIGVAGNFVLGMLMMIGIGLFAPCMILVYFLGLSPTVAFPIMMGSCAFLMPLASFVFVRRRSFHIEAGLGLALGGVPAVLIAAFLVKSLPLDAVRWLVVVVVVYAAAGLLRAARGGSPA